MQLNKLSLLHSRVKISLSPGLFVALSLCMTTAGANDSTLISGPGFVVDRETIESELRHLPAQRREKITNSEQALRELIDDFYRREAVVAKSITPELLKKPVYAYRLERARQETLFAIALDHQRSILLENLPPLEELAKERYLSKPKRFQVPPKIHARHILLKAETKEQKEKRRSEAKQLHDLLTSGADFGEVASEFSEDDHSASQQGDLGWVAADKLVPSFSEAAFALTNKGDLSDIVETRYGLHIIQLIDREPARTKKFEEVKPQLISALREEIVSTRMRQWYEDIIDADKMTAYPDTIKDFVEDSLKRN